MKEKKNIDNIFKEGFKNFEATPSPRVWENIQAELKKEKKERKVIPLWFKLSGVAALIALLLTVGNSLYTTSNKVVAPEITNENVDQVEKEFQENNAAVEKQAKDSQVASEDKTLQNESTLPGNASNKNTTENKVETKTSNKVLKNTPEKSGNTVIASNNSEKNNSKKYENSKNNVLEKQISNNNLNEGIATSKSTSEKIISDKSIEITTESTLKKDGVIIETKKESIAANENSEKKNSENSIVITEEEIAETSKNKKSIFDAIAEKDEETISEKQQKQELENRWNVAPNVAPVYYSSLGNGSSIDPSFADNPQDGDVNLSYGVQVSYSLNKRLSVRTGVNNVDLSYSTKGIDIGTGPVSMALRTVNYGGKDVVITAVDKGALADGGASNGFGDITLKTTQGDARLIQNINYYEVPVELKYALIDSRFGVNVIGGVSTLFLGNNEISVKADNFSSVLGEANNLSSVSFSTNVGLGLDYKLSKKFTFNIEPMFKYQLNTYTDSSVNFKPYYLGVYSGLSFRF